MSRIWETGSSLQVNSFFHSGEPEDMLLYSQRVTTCPYMSEVNPVHTVLKLLRLVFKIFNTCTMHLLLFCTMTNQCTINWQIYLCCCYMFHHHCVILRELVVCTLLSYTSMSVQLLVIQFKIISRMFFAVEISMFKILKLS